MQQIMKHSKTLTKTRGGKSLTEEIAEIEALTAQLNQTQSGMTSIDTNFDADQIELASIHRSTGLTHYQKGDYLEALSELEKAIKILPGDLELLFYEAVCLFQLGNLERASSILTQLAELDEDHTLPRLPKMLGMILLRQHKFKEAREYLQSVLSDYNHDLQLRNMIGFAYEREGNLEEAAKVFEYILLEDPHNPNACNSLAYIYYRNGKNLSRALELVKKALEKENDNPAYLDTLGMILAKQGNHESARTALKKALNKDPQNKEILKHLTELLNL